MNNIQREIAEKILTMLERQRFADWYNDGQFNDFITSAEPKPSREDVLLEIVRLAKL
jgi:hypothetical protein